MRIIFFVVLTVSHLTLPIGVEFYGPKITQIQYSLANPPLDYPVSTISRRFLDRRLPSKRPNKMECHAIWLQIYVKCAMKLSRRYILVKNKQNKTNFFRNMSYLITLIKYSCLLIS